MKRIIRILLLYLLIVLMAGFAAWPQTTTATILGVIKDVSGAVVPGVTITLKNIDTGFTRTALSNETGNYRAPNLPLGIYEVRIEMAGFKSFVETAIVLTVGREAVVDATLQIGEVSEKVEVTGESQIVNTTNATLEHLVDQTTIRSLPLNGRDYLQLATLQPGVLIMRQQRTSISPQSGTGVNMSIGGGRPGQNNFRMDGISTADHGNTSPGSSLGGNLGVEALREFSVMTNTYSAEFGRSAGGVINAVTRSGTNEFHGSAFFFHRNDNLDARNFFDPGALPEFRRHQFGISFGGPIIKDKTFVFANYEVLREVLGSTSRSNVLTQQAREGKLTSGTVTVDPLVKPYLDFYPLPNGTIQGDTGEFIGSPNRVSHDNFILVRGDHMFSEKARINGSYTFDDATVDGGDSLNLMATHAPSRRQFVSFEYTHLLSPRVVNVARFGYNQSDFLRGYMPINQRLADTALGAIPGHGAPVITITGMAGFPGISGGDKEGYNFRSYQGYDNVTSAFGRHALKFGFNFEAIQDDMMADQSPDGTFQFSSIPNFLTNKPDSLMGMAAGSDVSRRIRQQIWGFYVQEDFRAAPKLLLNLGLRYEFATVPYEADGKSGYLKSVMDPAVTLGSFFKNPTKRNFAPRVGLAWDPFGNQKTSIRTGFGVFYDLPLPHVITIPAETNPPFFKSFTLPLAPGDFPKNAYPKAIALGISDLMRTASMEYNARPSYRMQYNLSIQHEVFRSTIVTVAYVGGGARHLTRIGEDENLATPIVQNGRLYFAAGQKKPNPNFTMMRFWHWDANSFYNGLQLGVHRRLQNNIQLQGSYTYSRSVDDWSTTLTSAQFNNTMSNPYPLIRDLARGLSDFDIRQALLISGTWDIPAKLVGPAGKLLNGWQLGGIYTASAGLPFSPTMGGDTARTLTVRRNIQSGQRPDQAGNTNNPITGNPNQWFDPKAFKFPGLGYLGNLGRNTLIGPGLSSVDFSLVKDTAVSRISEAFRLQFRAEMFNALNHANFNQPAYATFDGQGKLVENVGRITHTVITNRQVQFGLKIIF